MSFDGPDRITQLKPQLLQLESIPGGQAVGITNDFRLVTHKDIADPKQLIQNQEDGDTLPSLSARERERYEDWDDQPYQSLPHSLLPGNQWRQNP